MLAFTLEAPSSFETASSPYNLALSDFNGDAIPDAAVSAASGKISVLLGDGSGSFVKRADLTLGKLAYGVMAADFNGDSNVDLVASDAASAKIGFFAGNGAGGFSAVVSSAFGSAAASDATPQAFLAVADLNGDQKQDVLVMNDVDHEIDVMLNDGNGNFTKSGNISLSGKDAGPIVSGDFNRDGKADVAYARATDEGIFIQLGDGAGGFGSATTLAVSGQVDGLTVADLDADAKLDLAATHSDRTTAADKLGILLGKGDGTFKPVIDYSAGNDPFAVTAADFNGDHRPELVVTTLAQQVLVFQNKGDGTFAKPSVRDKAFSSMGSTQAVAVGDFDLDGKQDVALAASSDATKSGGAVVALLSPAPPFAKLTSSGTLIGNGTNRKDVVSLTISGARNLIVKTLYGEQSFRAVKVKRIQVTLKAGSDKLVIGVGVAARATISGDSGRDTLMGGDDAEVIRGGAGADVIFGGGGDDWLSGDGGNDKIDGGAGADHLFGGSGKDSFAARDGFSDILAGDSGDDSAQLDKKLDRRSFLEHLLK
jgi:Ca2+-binding RTX toxin-like protein